VIRRALALVAVLGCVVALVPVLGPAPGRAGSAAPKVSAGRVHGTFQPRRGKLFVLVIGSDARAGNPNTRADAIHIVGLDTRTMRGGILNFPRDSWVSIPGHGQGRINEALYRGGPSLLARTLENVTGIRLDYWVMTGFTGFQRIIQRVGPVRFTLHRRIHDPTGSGADLSPGEQRLGPRQALAFVRTRHSFPRGDVDRTTNQARFLLALLRKLRREIDRRPHELFRWIAATKEHTRLDMTPEELFRLGVLTTQVRPDDVGNVTVPVSVGSVGAASVVFISPGAQSIYRRFRARARL
jgi:LCP family protein required for cell wall assembly